MTKRRKSDMGVSKNNGTPKSSILIGFSIINHPFWGIYPYFRKHPYIVIDDNDDGAVPADRTSRRRDPSESSPFGVVHSVPPVLLSPQTNAVESRRNVGFRKFTRKYARKCMNMP